MMQPPHNLQCTCPGETLEWLCTHPAHQMCTNCAPMRKGDKVELEMLCQHGPEGRCTNCLPPDSLVCAALVHWTSPSCSPLANAARTRVRSRPPQIDDRKHLSYEEFINKKKARCEHAFSAVCVNCMPPADISYKIRPGCTSHRPYPHGERRHLLHRHPNPSC